MSESTGVYVLKTSDGCRVRWGSYLEDYATSAFVQGLFRLSPFFPKSEDAIHYARLVEKANGPTEFGVIVLEKHASVDFDDLPLGS